MRNITVTFDDGTTHVYQNAPDDVTPELVTQRAVKQFPGRSVTALDGGKSAATPAPKAPPKVVTRQDEIRRLARTEVEAQNRRQDQALGTDVVRDIADFGEAAGASVANTFGIGPRIQAGISALKDDVPYRDALEFWRETNRAKREGSLTGDVTGALVGGGGLVSAGNAALRLASRGPQAVQAAGNYLGRLTQLQSGQKLANTGRILGVGGATGAAQAAGEGGDVTEGAAWGAGTAAGLMGAGNLIVRGARQLARPFSRSEGRAAREIIEEAPEAIARRQAEMSVRAGNNVPVIAALNERDFNNVTEDLLKKSPEAVEAARGAAGRYVRQFRDRMIGHVNRAGNQTAAFRPDMALGDMTQARRQIADDMMAPIADSRLDLTQLQVGDLERTLTQRVGNRVASISDRVGEALRDFTPAELQAMGIDPNNADAANMVRQWMRNPVDLTVREADSLRQLLDGAAEGADRAGNNVDALAFQNASRAVRDLVAETYPEYRRMIDVYARNSRMIEGFKTAAAGKRIEDIEAPYMADNLRTNEGRVGMAAGELHRQRAAVQGKPSEAIAAARDFAAEGNLTGQAGRGAPTGTVTENLGAQSARTLAQRSDAEVDALDRVIEAGGVKASAQNAADLDAGTIAFGASLALPGKTMPGTIARFAGRLLTIVDTPISRPVATNLAEMLFSGDPAQSQRALNALARLGIDEQVLRSQLIPAASGLMSGRDLGGEAQPVPEQSVPAEAPMVPLSPQARLDELHQSRGPEFTALASRVEQAESGGNPEAISPKGAIGLMQVMPATAPDAAALAGVPYDEEALRTDAYYNRLLGTAYLAAMIDQFNGNVPQALAAYNWGPGNVRRAVAEKKDKWLSEAPKETLDYLRKILG